MRRKRRKERATPRRGKERRMVDKTECMGGEVGVKRGEEVEGEIASF